MRYRVVPAGRVAWTTRPHEPGEPARHTAERSDLAGTLTMYLGEPPVREDVGAGGLIHVPPGTPLQTENQGDVDLLVYAYGFPPDDGAEVLPDAV